MKADLDESWASSPSAIVVMVIIKFSALRALTRPPPSPSIPNGSLVVSFSPRRYYPINSKFSSCFFLSANARSVWRKVSMSKGRDFKVDSVKFEFWLPDLMQTLQVKWFVSKGQRLPIGHSTQRHQLPASRRLHSELTYLNSSHRSHNVAVWGIMMVGYPWFLTEHDLRNRD